MELGQKPLLSQSLVLTQAMRQSLDCLQLSALELNEYVQELSLSNPLLEVQTFSPAEKSIQEVLPKESLAIQIRDFSDFSLFDRRSAEADLGACLTRECTFREYLEEQVGQMKLLNAKMQSLCKLVIGCLDSRGYLDYPLKELSEWTNYPVRELEQALFTVQMLDPPGVGARSLSECLILQLSQGSSFNHLTLSIARDGLDLLSRRNYSALARKLQVSINEAKQAAEAVLALNPIPSRGFSDDRPIIFVAPDAFLRAEGGKLTVELNERTLPRLSIHAEYAVMLNASIDCETEQYIKEKLAEAELIIKSVHSRSDTLLKLLAELADIQKGYFFGRALVPLTMQQLADRMGVSISTVSRAVQGKTIQYEGRILPLRDFFTTAVVSDDGAAVSSQAIKLQLRHLINTEDPSAPLSDESIRSALKSSGVDISRRTVAKYRIAMGIESSSKRKRG